MAALVPFGVAQALAVPPAPPIAQPVVDQTGTLSSSQVATITDQINTSRTQKDYQLAILLIKSLEGTAIEDYSLKVARAWGIGDKTANNGVLLLIAKDDRQMRIEVGRGIEADLTDAESGRIIRNTISPQFKKGDYYSGISLGVQNIAAQVEGRPQADTSVKVVSTADKGRVIEGILALIFIGFSGISWLAAILARSKSWWAGGAAGGLFGVLIAFAAAWVWWAIGLLVVLILGGLLLDWAVSRNFAKRVTRGDDPAWWAGGTWLGGSSGSGGDFGGFGGGDFGGGGASGSW